MRKVKALPLDFDTNAHGLDSKLLFPELQHHANPVQGCFVKYLELFFGRHVGGLHASAKFDNQQGGQNILAQENMCSITHVHILFNVKL